LCRDAEQFANQDHIAAHEETLTHHEIDIETVENYNISDYEADGLTLKQRQIYRLHRQGLSSIQIGRQLRVNDGYIRKVLIKIRNNR